MTELSPVATLLLDEDHADPVLRRSAGRAAPHAEVKIVDPDGNEVPRGTVGEIAVAGDHVMLGYWNKPEETAAAVRDGWMHTGDGGYMDENGYVFIVDRIKDMIISGGENVYSIEVENAVANHPSVAQVAVIGVPDPQWGERVHAVVGLVPGGTLDLDELRAHCRAEIADLQGAAQHGDRRGLPVSAAGKILKRDLRKRYEPVDADRLSTTVGFHGPGRSLIVESVGTTTIRSGSRPSSDLGHGPLDVVRRIT